MEFSKWLQTDDGKQWSDQQQKLTVFRERVWNAAMEWWHAAGEEPSKGSLMAACATLATAQNRMRELEHDLWPSRRARGK